MMFTDVHAACCYSSFDASRRISLVLAAIELLLAVCGICALILRTAP